MNTQKMLFISAIAAILLGMMTPNFSLAASDMALSSFGLSDDGKNYEIQLACIAHTDGTFTAKEIVPTDGLEYWTMGFYLYEVHAINPAAVYPTVAASVTLTDEMGTPVLASGELSLSTSASGKAEAVFSKFRAVRSKLTGAVGDTGSAANQFILRIVMAR